MPTLIFPKRCDTNGDGKLDYQEFKAMIFRSKTRKEEIAQKEELLQTPGKRAAAKKKEAKVKKAKGKAKGKGKK